MCDLNYAEHLFRSDALEDLAALARRVTRDVFGTSVYFRGLIEISNHCTQNCLYCGIRRDHAGVHRYRLDRETIIQTVKEGFTRGLRTFVLQGGEDPWYTTDRMTEIITSIKEVTGDAAAVTLSCGMQEKEVYAAWKRAGADRYLIRFETSDPRLHAYIRDGRTLDERLCAIEDLRSLGYQVGSGFMVGLPGEDEGTIVDNIRLCRALRLDMAGIGPFIPHPDTPLGTAPQQPLRLALRATALLRIACPRTHIPATTAAGSLSPDGREQMISCGANVVMPNLTPISVKKAYLLYPGKICLDEDGVKCLGCLSMRIASTGNTVSLDRGDGLVHGMQ